MPVKIEAFKKAFSTKVNEDQYKGRRGAAIAVIRETEEFVKLLGATDRAKEHAMSLAKIYVQIDNADKLAVKSRDKAYDALDRARNEAITLRGLALADAKQQYLDHRKKADSAFKALEKSPHAKKLSAPIEKAKGDLTVIQRLADANRFGEAIKQADDVAAECTTARVKEELRKGEAPKKSDFEALAKLPGLKGKNRLDELISELPDDTAAKAFKVAFEVRFGQRVDTFKDKKGLREDVKWKWDNAKNDWVAEKITDPKEWEKTDDTKPNKSLKKMYELFTKVPESHVNAAQNPSLNRITHFEKDAHGAAYSGYKKSIYMYVSRGSGTGAEDQSVELATGKTGKTVMFPEPPKRDPTCTPINTNIKTPYFDWATLHEVGHAVDDKTGFMKTNASDSKFGGWAKESLDSVAKVGADHFKWDQAYIKEKLQGKAATVPDSVKKNPKWADVQKEVDKWCLNISNPDSSGIWWDGRKSNDSAIDKRVYQEAYSGDWVSYELAARTKGIHGYQFRAPGEWFAELYAAYYCEKLQDAHPFVAELKKLEKPS